MGFQVGKYPGLACAWPLRLLAMRDVVDGADIVLLGARAVDIQLRHSGDQGRFRRVQIRYLTHQGRIELAQHLVGVFQQPAFRFFQARGGWSCVPPAIDRQWPGLRRYGEAVAGDQPWQAQAARRQ